MFALSPTVVAMVAACGGVVAGWWTARRTLTTRLTVARHQATHDPLTGAANRAGLHTTASQLLAGAVGPVVVAVIDLVGFKAVNDRHGHDVGDLVLATVADRLARITGPAGVAARLGGDEFAAVATIPADVDPARWVEHWLRDLHHHLTTPVDHDGVTVAVGATIGAVLADRTRPLPVWLSAADHAMYRARADRTTTAITTTVPATNPTVGERPACRIRDMARPTSRLSTVTPTSTTIRRAA